MSGEDDSLATLIEYNREDVVNLERLAEIAYSKLRAEVTTGTVLAEPLRNV